MSLSMPTVGSPMYVNYMSMRAAIARSRVIVTTVDADVLALAQSEQGSVSRNVDEIHAMLCTDLCEKHYGRCFSDESHNESVKAEFDTLFSGPVTHRRVVKRPVYATNAQRQASEATRLAMIATMGCGNPECADCYPSGM